MTTQTPATALRLAESIPETPDNYPILRELIQALKDLVALTEPAPFDHMAPLPDLHIRKSRSWEPATRHYRDLSEDEKAQNEKAVDQ